MSTQTQHTQANLRSMAARTLLKVAYAESKDMMCGWFRHVRIQHRVAMITRRRRAQSTLSHMQYHTQWCRALRRKGAEILQRKRGKGLRRAFAMWTRKAKIFSHISDLASLSCRILVNLSRAPHLVTVTNLDPSKYLRAYYMRERTAFCSWLAYATRRLHLRHTARRVVSRMLRCRHAKTVHAWRRICGVKNSRDMTRITMRLRNLNARREIRASAHALAGWNMLAHDARMDARLAARFAARRLTATMQWCVDWWVLFVGCRVSEQHLQSSHLGFSQHVCSALQGHSPREVGSSSATQSKMGTGGARWSMLGGSRGGREGGGEGRGAYCESESTLSEPMTQFSQRHCSHMSALSAAVMHARPLSTTWVGEEGRGKQACDLSEVPLTQLSRRSFDCDLRGGGGGDAERDSLQILSFSDDESISEDSS